MPNVKVQISNEAQMSKRIRRDNQEQKILKFIHLSLIWHLDFAI
jgi:hypothetical protein